MMLYDIHSRSQVCLSAKQIEQVLRLLTHALRRRIKFYRIADWTQPNRKSESEFLFFFYSMVFIHFYTCSTAFFPRLLLLYCSLMPVNVLALMSFLLHSLLLLSHSNATLTYLYLFFFYYCFVLSILPFSLCLCLSCARVVLIIVNHSILFLNLANQIHKNITTTKTRTTTAMAEK